MAFIKRIKAFENETVEIQWACGDGSTFIQRIVIPPKATREARAEAEK